MLLNQLAHFVVALNQAVHFNVIKCHGFFFLICVSHKDVQAAEMCVMQCGLCPCPMPVCYSVAPLDFNAYLWHQPFIHPSPEMFGVNVFANPLIL